MSNILKDKYLKWDMSMNRLNNSMNRLNNINNEYHFEKVKKII